MYLNIYIYIYIDSYINHKYHNNNNNKSMYNITQYHSIQRHRSDGILI